ncbi:class F sortase [Kribbella sp. CA-293567]|uniref:class F sortase n=1 Tax=Kribbella sp. CA-293567 TaxID=3002436 RepID=UPI0022DCF557|nr:class F sortase [Kribbella sp. CA-293567]WBQ03298.1 class F sortase [Kribbella sp. CA-293567]
MTAGRRRGRPSPIRRSGWVVLIGLCLAVTGVSLQLTGSPGAEGASGLPVAGSPELVGSPDEVGSPDRAGSVDQPLAEEIQPPAAAPNSRVRAAAKPSASSSARPAAVEKRPSPAARPGVPSRIAIARLGVIAPVVPIKALGGSLTPPSNPRQVGWWSGGALPGALRGSAVITGHTVHNGGGAFDDLEQVRSGDVVGVSTSRGLVRYRVTGVTTYRKQALARSAIELFGQSRPGRLVLVTCEDWTGKVYLSNVVVLAERIA